MSEWIKCEYQYIQVWGIHTRGDDRTDGPVTAWFSTKEVAKQAAYRTGWYGGDARVSEHFAIALKTHYPSSKDTYIEYFVVSQAGPIDLDGKLKENQERIRKEALEKLTDIEKAVLGLK